MKDRKNIVPHKTLQCSAVKTQLRIPLNTNILGLVNVKEQSDFNLRRSQLKAHDTKAQNTNHVKAFDGFLYSLYRLLKGLYIFFGQTFLHACQTGGGRRWGWGVGDNRLIKTVNKTLNTIHITMKLLS